jgi:HPt (histidine-containing phosphotransfer) domain-containing protein
MVDHELDELRREFLDEARQKTDEMEAVLGNGESRDSLDRLAYLAHQLKGSGGSYGYQRISTSAAELERAVEGAGTTPAADKPLTSYVGELRAAIDRAMNELG